MTDRAVIAANNNADLYQIMFAAHGRRYIRKDHAFIAVDQPPPYYSQMTILDRVSDAILMQEFNQLTQHFDVPIGLKDSFNQLDLTSAHLEPMFDAHWVWRAASGVASPSPWQMIQTPAQLRAWEQAWKDTGSPTSQLMFPDALLGRDDIVFFAKWLEDMVVAGCIANRSTYCVGLSNIFHRDATQAGFEEATASVAHLDPSMPIVGYARGDNLVALCNAGHEPVGPLRVWYSE